MRTFRWLAAACAVAILPAVSAAQSVRGFDDSWFWGVKAGIASFSTSQVKNATVRGFAAAVDLIDTRSVSRSDPLAQLAEVARPHRAASSGAV